MAGPTRDRPEPLVLTPLRALAVAVVSAALVAGVSRLVARIQRFADFTVPTTVYLVAFLLLTLVGVLSLRTEDARLGRELRIAYAGTVTARAQAVRRRMRASFLTRFFTPPHGFAALLLASGDAEAARESLETGSPLFLAALGHRLGELRALIASAARASLAAEAAERAGVNEERSAALVDLLSTPPLGSGHVERFRAFLQARAVLEAGDTLTARDLAFDLRASTDADVRLYAEWLRTWFDLDDPALAAAEAGERRRAALLAANAGARDLAAKLA